MILKRTPKWIMYSFVLLTLALFFQVLSDSSILFVTRFAVFSSIDLTIALLSGLVAGSFFSEFFRKD